MPVSGSLAYEYGTNNLEILTKPGGGTKSSGHSSFRTDARACYEESIAFAWRKRDGGGPFRRGREKVVSLGRPGLEGRLSPPGIREAFEASPGLLGRASTRVGASRHVCTRGDARLAQEQDPSLRGAHVGEPDREKWAGIVAGVGPPVCLGGGGGKPVLGNGVFAS